MQRRRTNKSNKNLNLEVYLDILAFKYIFSLQILFRGCLLKYKVQKIRCGLKRFCLRSTMGSRLRDTGTMQTGYGFKKSFYTDHHFGICPYFLVEFSIF